MSASLAVKSVAPFLQNLVNFNFLLSLLTTWRKHDLVQWRCHVVRGPAVVLVIGLGKICNVCEPVFFLESESSNCRLH